MAQITPFVKRMRTQGGTLYTFSSAVEDIGLNINERNNVVKMSHFALLDIPKIQAPDSSINQNRFNVLGINGALKTYVERNSILDGKVLVAESFQNYALNLETILLSQDDYNPSLLKTVSERVFWKWLKESGAIRWVKDNSNPGYWIEEPDMDSDLQYSSVVKYVGEISAGSVRTDTFGTYNETYVLVPTSHGQTKVYFKQDYDDNYYPDMTLFGEYDQIYGRESYIKPHPDGLSILAHYDVIDSSTLIEGVWSMEVDKNDGSGYIPGTWYTAQGKTFVDENWYATDSSTILNDASAYNYNIKYTNGGDTIEFKRSNVDGLGIEYNLTNLRNIFGDSTLTFDKMAIEESVDDSFSFNAVLIYYTIYNKTLDKSLSTNLLGILFLDSAVGNSAGFPVMEIEIPQITKLQSTISGFGTSYSFRVNVKSDNMIDDTQAVIYDESTSGQTVLENWTDVFANLEKTLNILNTHTGTINYITEQYMDISDIQTQQNSILSDLQYQLNDVTLDIQGTPNTIALFASGDDPLVDSSIYMSRGKIGVFTPDPSYGFHVDCSMKTYDIVIENAIRDTSGNILLGYGSPLQIGSSTNFREVNIYTGHYNPVINIDTNRDITIDTSLLFITGDVSIIGNLNVVGNVNIPGYIKDSCIGVGLYWVGGLLDVSVVGGGSGTPGGLNTHVQYNDNGTFGGSSNFTWDGTKLDVNGNFDVNGNAIIGGNITVSGDTDVSIAPSNAVRTFTIQSNMNTAGNGGNIVIRGGNSIIGRGGNVYINGGDGISDGSIYIGTSTTSGINSLVSIFPTGTPSGDEVLFIDADNQIKRGTNSKLTSASWTAGTTAGPTLSLSGDGMTTLTATIPSASNTTSGIITNAAQTIAGVKTFSSATSFSEGTAAVPGTYFGTDTNTGFIHPGADTIGFSVGGNEYFRMESDGDFHAEGNLIGYSTTISDIRLKRNIEKLENSLDKILMLNGVSYQTLDKDEVHFGLIAQETEKIIPEIILETNILGKDSDEIYKTIKYTEVIPLLIESIKEQQKMINDLKQEINILKNK